nr:unnamed protein product [Digitaria exilis]
MWGRSSSSQRDQPHPSSSHQTPCKLVAEPFEFADDPIPEEQEQQ